MYMYDYLGECNVDLNWVMRVASCVILTWWSPVTASLYSCVRMSMVSLLYFSSFSNSFIGTASDFYTGWIGSTAGTNSSRSWRLENILTRNSMMNWIACCFSTLASLWLGETSSLVLDWRDRWGVMSDPLNLKSGMYLILIANCDVTFIMDEWQSIVQGIVR